MIDVTLVHPYPIVKCCHSRCDIHFRPVDSIGDCSRLDLSNIGKDQKDEGDKGKDGRSSYAMFSSHRIGVGAMLKVKERDVRNVKI